MARTPSAICSPLPEFTINCTVGGCCTLASEVEVLARFGRALADPIRCRLLLALREAPAHPSDLADDAGRLPHPAVQPPGLPARLRPGRRRARRAAHPLRTRRPSPRPRPGRPAHRRGRRRGGPRLPGRRRRRAAADGRPRRPGPAAGAPRPCSPGGSGCWWRRPSPTTSSRPSIALAAGTRASSTALIGFGSGLRGRGVVRGRRWPGSSPAATTQARGRKGGAAPHRVLVLRPGRLRHQWNRSRSLFGLGEAKHSTVRASPLRPSASLVVMPVLSLTQRRAGARTRLARQRSPTPSRHCCAPTCPRCCWSGCCSTSLLGWSWADPVAALVIAAVAVREGLQAWRGDRLLRHPVHAGHRAERLRLPAGV